MDIYSLLNIDSAFASDFPLQARNIEDYQTDKVINYNVRRLKQMEERESTEKQFVASNESIDEVVSKVKELAWQGAPTTWTVQELRIMSNYLVKFHDDDDVFNYVIRTIRNNWKNIFFNGLAFYVLGSWNNLKKEHRISVCTLIVEKLTEYSGNGKKYMQMKNHANFFEEAGPTRMTALIMARHLPLWEAPTLLGYREVDFSFSYFSEVILTYFRSRKITDLSIVDNVFDKHKHDRTKKLLFAHLVDQAEKSNDVLRQEQVSRYATKVLGDISIAATWAPFNRATVDEIILLSKAKEHVNNWVKRRAIEVFFEVCVQDPTRKAFWLDYIPKIVDFKIAGSDLVKGKLLNDPRITNIIKSKFVPTYSRTNQTAALILEFPKRVLIEFSDRGAVYAYRKNHEKVSFLKRKNPKISGVETLKIPSLPTLSDFDFYDGKLKYPDEGRLAHQGYWQERLQAWINRKLIEDSDESNQTTNSSQPTNPPKANYVPERKENETNSIDIKFNLSSKTLFNNACSIVANYNGFYLRNLKRNTYSHLRNMEEGEYTAGAIWVESAKFYTDGWMCIKHVQSNDKEIVVGWIKAMYGKAYFRTNWKEESTESVFSL